ncbi:MAG: competence/damage-inducible protein A [Verrucomicrobiota bacterium]|nr:competence/damage-inducible protein A [Verrucomicrobiota bacterium]
MARFTNMQAAVINTGTELLLGKVVNSHLAFLGHHLFPLGIRITWQATVPDGESIYTALESVMGKYPIVIITGGLGPTSDDVTRDMIAKVTGNPLKLDPDAEKSLRVWFMKRSIPMDPSNLVQSLVPEGGRIIPNPNGTAPGIYLQHKDTHFFLLPGPPRELCPMFQDALKPLLLKIFPNLVEPLSRSFRMTGIGESAAASTIQSNLNQFPSVEVGYCIKPGDLEIRLLSSDSTALESASQVVERKLRSFIFSAQGKSMEQTVVDLLITSGKTCSIAESCTGGLIGHRITNVPGSSAVFKGGVIAYHNSVKSNHLGVPDSTLEKKGAVSAETAVAMAEGVRTNLDADYGVAVTGIAGPASDDTQKSVGLVFVAVAGSGKTVVEEKNFKTDRETFKILASQAALDLLRRTLG